MRVPLRWLQEYVKVNLTPEELAERLTMAGLEVTAIPTPIACSWQPWTTAGGSRRLWSPAPRTSSLSWSVRSSGR